MTRYNDNELALLRSAHVYADNNCVAFNGHNMILLLAKIDTERLRLVSLIENISDVFDEGDYSGVRKLLAENFSERD